MVSWRISSKIFPGWWVRVSHDQDQDQNGVLEEILDGVFPEPNPKSPSQEEILQNTIQFFNHIHLVVVASS